MYIGDRNQLGNVELRKIIPKSKNIIRIASPKDRALYKYVN